jgi:hypothetical protein
MPKNKKEHIFIKNADAGGYELWCKNCDVKYEPDIPCPMDMFLDIMKSFNKTHKNCETKGDNTDGE